MQTEDFIRNKIKTICDLFNDVEIYYEYKEYSETHFIKILPKQIFTNSDFRKLKASITIEFVKNKLEGLICFVSEDSAVSFNEPTIYSNRVSIVEPNRTNVNNHTEFRIQNISKKYSYAA